MQQAARLDVSRHAARLFVERGVAGASGDDIAAAAGLSKRTVWRYFRNKESCVEPLFDATSLRFIALLRDWPRTVSIEAWLQACLGAERRSAQELADDVLAVRLLALLPDEPDLRCAWLMSVQRAEEALAAVVAERLERSSKDAEVRLCAATVMAAIRVVDETISIAAVRHRQAFTIQDVIERLARAIRAASTLPICDPVTT
ncbi:TetR/AcrR family transcriptional regulator [Telluria beijingensis]|uniref:TetR/AcrR family transcriptional regulator n=1 Tax=Telluria beijingensis TaxID=3068633 RepID=UPI00279555BE|nr:TetR/AcrR family transcriptional regulator [Massilia sp. REN29]